MKRRFPLAVVLLLLATVSFAAVLRPPPAPEEPAWFVGHVRAKLADGGRWIADNAAYRSAEEPLDAYGIQWTPGIGGKGLRGRLFGLQGEREVATFWELSTFWHPGEERVVAQQHGTDGTFGTGTLRPAGEVGTELEQTYWAPDGTTRRVRHEEAAVSDGEHASVTLRPDGEGWAVERNYLWVRTPSSESEDG